jgi:hypothetical protein
MIVEMSYEMQIIRIGNFCVIGVHPGATRFLFNTRVYLKFVFQIPLVKIP